MPSKTTKTKNKRKRDYSLDFLRGTVVLLMIITHVNGTFHNGTSPLLGFFTFWGATLCLTTFLFVSGSVTAIGLKRNKITRKKMFMRFLEILAIYYITAIVSKVFYNSFSLSLENLVEIFTFQDIVEFTEFMIPFFMYPLLVAIFLKPLQYLIKKPAILGVIALLIFALSMMFYQLNVTGDLAITIKSLLVGHEDLHRFGVLTYLPIFIIGLVWGTQELSNKKATQRNAGISLLFLVAAYILLFVTGNAVWNRYPPSVLFLMHGLFYSLLVLFAYRYIEKAKSLVNIMVFLGKYAMLYYAYHVVLLYIFGDIIGWNVLSAWQTVALFVIIMTSVTGFIYLPVVLRNRVTKANNV